MGDKVHPLTQEIRREALRCTPLFAGVQPADLDQLASHASERRFDAGEMLVRRGEPGQSLIVLVYGRSRVSASSAEGREVTLGLLGPGSVIGDMGMLDGKPRSADVIAMSAGAALVLERSVVLPFLRERPDVLLHLLELLCERLRRANAALEDLALAPLAARLARVLLLIAADHGVAGPGGTRLRLRLSQSELATQIGASREAVNRQLRRWRADGVVGDADGALVITQPDALRGLISE